jgi:16S rRNA (cytosine1402-N4)-methyltransferase
VLLDEVVFLLRPRREGWLIDGTVGMGGHAEALLETTPPAVRLLGLDADPEALARARQRLGRFGERVRLVHANFRTLARVACAEGVEAAQAVLLDLGVSTVQLEASGRGFSFQRDEPLDMRWDPAVGRPAAELLNRLDEAALARLLREYGEEPHARRIARAVIRHRPLRTTAELVAVIQRAVPRRAWPRRLHVATRTFQALRVAVNDELEALRAALPQAAALLAPGGRLAIIAFHSGEDRLVKQAFRALAPAGYLPVEPAPLRPAPEEVRANPRARSARLRVLERVA